MTTIVLLNSYPMRRAFDWWRGAGRSHVWGFAALAAAHDLEVRFDDAEAPASAFNRLLARLPQPHNVRLQLGYLLHCRRVDAVYAATYSLARLLGLARALRLFRPRVIALAHFPLRPGLIERLALRGVDRLLFLCHATEQAVLKDFSAVTARASYLGWAADLDFYADARRLRAQRPAAAPGQLHIVAAGKDNRDYQTLVEGFAQVPGPLLVSLFCARDCAPVVTDPRVQVHGADSVSNPLPIQALLKHCAQADVMAIPLLPVGRVAGLTSLIDAMALGRRCCAPETPGWTSTSRRLAVGCG